eukprot:NODE_1539_length_915_cov_23.786374_g1195_i0.p1 GENE.NODE_1539_length_915_cov_23.786374_g1195_i0~~NODE_1539_length_915_cov_23.786374_g1195_i0.p1  ORF type:complete len:255 (-),score=43.22 NODE_1539_length_915_cov_23.786374_g1195_i0:30-794(-)
MRWCAYPSAVWASLPLSRCDKCNRKQNATKQFSFLSLPRVLCVCVKRFEFGTFWGSKISDYVTFPMPGTPNAVLDLSPHCYQEHHPLPPSCTYSLIGAVVHRGGLGAGHYIAYVCTGEDWVVCDDDAVYSVPVEEVMNTEAYVLLYQKITPPPSDEALRLQRAARQYLMHPLDRGDCYIARYWLQSLMCGCDPGVLMNDVCCCPAEQPHAHPSVASFYVPVAEAHFDAFVAMWGGGPKITATRYQELMRTQALD